MIKIITKAYDLGVKMLNSEWLLTFKTLIEINHFTLTAKKLNMTQPGVSQHITKLEDACGHQLITRINKGFEITEKGRLVYEYAKTLIESELKLRSKLDLDSPYKGNCYLSCSGSMALKLYPHFLKLQKENSELIIFLESAPDSKIFDDILKRKIEIGLVHQIPDQKLFECKKIGKEELNLIFPRQFSQKKITTNTFMECGLIDHPNAKMYLSLYLEQSNDKILKSLKLENIPTIGYINQLEQIPLPITKGIGFTVLPQFALEKFGKKSSYHKYTPKKPISKDVYIIKKRGTELPSRYLYLEQYITSLI